MQQDAGLEVNGHAWGNEAAILLEGLLLEGTVLPHGKGNPGKRKSKQIDYINILSAFDIETTCLQDIQQSYMYIWQWHFVNIETGENVTIYGRYWSEWQACVRLICDTLKDNCYLVVLDHNLSYEFAFLTEYYPFTVDEVFCTDPRAVLKCSMHQHLEFRCTMRHSNTSLSVYLKQWNVVHQKLDGEEFDYNKIRYPWTELTAQEMKYALHDVIGLCEAYIAEMKFWGDTLYTVPYTSTGYVRRICKKEWARINYYERRSWMPDLEVLRLLDEAFRGGDTHGNRRHATPESLSHAVIVPNVDSYDRVSSYPDVLINCMYPLGDWYKIQTKKQKWIKQDIIEKYINQYEKAIVTRVHFKGLRLKIKIWGMPYIPDSKCIYIDNKVLDNGRVLSADYLSMTITDVDWRIISREYEWDDVYFSDTYYCRYRYLPEFFCEVVRQFYRDKTILKGAEPGSLEAIEYNLKKQLLNSLYGMAAQHVLKESVYYIADTNEYISEIDYKIREKEDELKRTMTEKEKRDFRAGIEQETVEKHNKNAFMPFQVGVWCTAWARLELHRSMWVVWDQGGRVVYVDTDSNKCTGNIDFTALNDYYQKRSLSRGAYADDKNGKRYYMGLYDHEYTAPKFAHMGAKKYVYEDEKGGFHLTIAGVNKRKGAEELLRMGGFAAFHSGTKFTEAGGVQGVYNDDPYGNIQVDGHDLYIGRNVCLLPDTYTLGESQDYARILDYLLIHGQIDGETLGGGED